jgi:hypothetical protein
MRSLLSAAVAMDGGVRDSGVRTGGAKSVELQLGAIDPCGCNAGSRYHLG